VSEAGHRPMNGKRMNEWACEATVDHGGLGLSEGMKALFWARDAGDLVWVGGVRKGQARPSKGVDG